MTADRTRPPALAHQRFQNCEADLRELPLAARFDYIYRSNLWGSPESASGLGSAVAETGRLRAELPRLLAELGAARLLDIPCGDFTWMRELDLPLVYIGADIVDELVERNRALHGRTFLRLDLTCDPLPRADVVLCRDCLVHLSFANIFAAFANLKRGGGVWLLMTTFVDQGENQDIADGDWRPLNFERPPFQLPPPQAVIVEGCTECGGAYADKALGLWPIDCLPLTLQPRS